MRKSKLSEYKMIQHLERCKGCGFCISQCPSDALYLSESVNSKGYPVAKIDEGKCTKCAICYTVCPDYVFERVKGA